MQKAFDLVFVASLFHWIQATEPKYMIYRLFIYIYNEFFSGDQQQQQQQQQIIISIIIILNIPTSILWASS